MSQIRDFSIAIPLLCGASEADRASTVNKLIFDAELLNKDSAFQRTEQDKLDPYNRMKSFFRFENGNKKIIKHCKKLLRIAELSHYKSEHSLDSVEEIELSKLIKSASIAESDVELASVVSALSVKQALSTETWNG